MFEPVKTAVGHFLHRFYDQITPTTRPMLEYVKRGYSRSVFLAPARMVDAAEDMVAKYQRLDLNDGETVPHKLPVIIVAVAKDYTPTMRDYTRQIADARYVTIPDDPKQRAFKVRTVAGDLRCQMAIFAQDSPTAMSLAAQLCLWLDNTENRRFEANYRFAGFDTWWTVQIESPEAIASSIPSESKNLTILAVDINLHCNVPLFYFPKEGEPNDGKGTDFFEDPSGYPVIERIDSEWMEIRR